MLDSLHDLTLIVVCGCKELHAIQLASTNVREGGTTAAQVLVGSIFKEKNEVMRIVPLFQYSA